MIFSKNTIKDAARLSMAKWYNKVEEAGFHSFNVIAATFHEHYNEILNFYNNRSSNAMAESFNAKIKLFRANLRGVVDKKFFLFRIANLYAYPHEISTDPQLPEKFWRRFGAPLNEKSAQLVVLQLVTLILAEREGFEPPEV